jgi:hypothetical protein
MMDYRKLRYPYCDHDWPFVEPVEPERIEEPERIPETWELHKLWLWTPYRGSWHVVMDTVLGVDGEYAAFLSCGKRVPIWTVELTTGFALKNDSPGAKFCRECRSRIVSELLRLKLVKAEDVV